MKDIKQRMIGNAKKIGSLEDNSNQRRKIYDSNCISPTIQAAYGMGGGNVPMIIEEFYESRNPRIYKEYAPTIRSGRIGLEVIEEENVEKVGIKQATKQGFIECEIGGVADFSYPESKYRRGRVQGGGQICPTLTSSGEICRIEKPISTNGTEISGTIRATYYKNGERNIVENIEHGLGYEGVIEPQVLCNKRTEYGKQIRKDYEAHNIEEKRGNMTQLEPRKDGVCQTITSVQKDNMLLEPQMVACRGRYTEDGTTEQRLELNNNGTSNTITSVQKDTMLLENKEKKMYRIRKLTPKETWRLMGFSDNDYDCAASVNSKTQLYKQAGNSIVENVLVAIFGQMFEGHENDYKTAVQ